MANENGFAGSQHRSIAASQHRRIIAYVNTLRCLRSVVYCTDEIGSANRRPRLSAGRGGSGEGVANAAVDANCFVKIIADIKEAIRRENEVAADLKCAADICAYGRWYDLRDADGNTALLAAGQKLLRKGCFEEAVQLAKILLDEGSDVNAINNENKTLLSYSIQYMDESIRLTTLLVNYGANVWPMVVAGVDLGCSCRDDSRDGSNERRCDLYRNYHLNRQNQQHLHQYQRRLRHRNRYQRLHHGYVISTAASSTAVATAAAAAATTTSSSYHRLQRYYYDDAVKSCGESDATCDSAFTWFLMSVMRQLKLSDHCLRTLYLLAEVMGENPETMRSHVMSTMFGHAKCFNILGPVFLRIKSTMCPYWTQPPRLKYLCKSVIRKCIFSAPGRFINAENISSLMLPPSMQSYLMLEC